MRTRQVQIKHVERNRRFIRVETVRKEIVQCAPVYVEFGKYVKKARMSAGLRQADLAAAIGVSRASIANVEAGRQQVLLGDLFKYAAALGVSVRAITAHIGPYARSSGGASDAE